jgi:hypothetical protein
MARNGSLDLALAEGIDEASNIRKEHTAAPVVGGSQMPLYLPFHSCRYDNYNERQ